MLTSGPSPGGPGPRVRPSRTDLYRARGKTLPDVAGPGLRVLFSGINPGLYSAATGYHFARPGNRFWPALHRSGFTPRQLDPSEQEQLLELGLGITNIAARATARADELDAAELREGGRLLQAKVEALAPQWLAIAGVGAFAAAFGRKKVIVGPQDLILGRARVWVLPNPSGLNAHWPTPRLTEAYAELREAADS
jgi:double-stranded uracil-DNA glycosylase